MRAVCLLVLWVFAATPVVAQELEPRSYVNVPIGQTSLVLGYARTEGNVLPSPSVPVEDATITMDGLALGIGHTFDLLGSSAKFDLSTARYCYDGQALVEGQPESAERCEWGDTRARVTWNFYGAEALSLEDFRSNWSPGLTIGTSLQVEIPTGEYSSDNIINAGTNRWMVRPGVGMSYIWQGWFIDAQASVKFFQDNPDYLGNRIEQDPLYQGQFHLLRFFAPGAWISLDANVFIGGESTRDTFELDDGLENARLGVTVSLPLKPRHSVRLAASSGVIAPIGNDFDLFSVSYFMRL